MQGRHEQQKCIHGFFAFSVGRRPPESLNNVFQPLLTKRSPRVAKLLIWLLGRVQSQEGGNSMEEQDEVLMGLERICSLLEQYYHPSNNGK